MWCRKRFCRTQGRSCVLKLRPDTAKYISKYIWKDPQKCVLVFPAKWESRESTLSFPFTSSSCFCSGYLKSSWRSEVKVAQPHLTLCAHQASLSIGFSRQEYWSGLPCPSPGDLPHPGIEPRFPALQVDSLRFELPRKPKSNPSWGLEHIPKQNPRELWLRLDTDPVIS